eukprot:scaffold5479_cov199-Amphora_coffeaeformis.AAC.62
MLLGRLIIGSLSAATAGAALNQSLPLLQRDVDRDRRCLSGRGWTDCQRQSKNLKCEKAAAKKDSSSITPNGRHHAHAEVGISGFVQYWSQYWYPTTTTIAYT